MGAIFIGCLLLLRGKDKDSKGAIFIPGRESKQAAKERGRCAVALLLCPKF